MPPVINYCHQCRRSRNPTESYNNCPPPLISRPILWKTRSLFMDPSSLLKIWTDRDKIIRVSTLGQQWQWWRRISTTKNLTRNWYFQEIHGCPSLGSCTFVVGDEEHASIVPNMNEVVTWWSFEYRGNGNTYMSVGSLHNVVFEDWRNDEMEVVLNCCCISRAQHNAYFSSNIYCFWINSV